MKTKVKVAIGLMAIQSLLINSSVLADTTIVNDNEVKTELEKTTSTGKDDVIDDAEKYSSLIEETIVSEKDQIETTDENKGSIENVTDPIGKPASNEAKVDTMKVPRAAEIPNEYPWSKEGFSIYAKPKIDTAYAANITFPTDDTTLGSEIGDTLEGYVELPLTAIVYYEGANMFYGDKYMSDKTSGMTYRNDIVFHFNLKETDESAFEVKVVKKEFPDNDRPKIPNSPTANVGNKAKFFIQIKRLKKTKGNRLEIPTDLIWDTTYYLQNGAQSMYMNHWQYNAETMYFIPLETEPVIETKDSTLYSTQSYNPIDNFVGGTDLNGEEIKWDDKKMEVSGDIVDMNKPGVYKQLLTYTYSFQGENRKLTSEYLVTVKEDKTAIEAKASSIFEGETYDYSSGFVGAWDKDGNEVPFSDEIWWHGTPQLDVNTPGSYPIFYGLYNANGKRIYTSKRVSVKNETALETQSSTIYVGDTWSKKDNFVSAKDLYGNEVKWESDAISTNGFQIDTSKPGKHEITYTIKSGSKTVDSNFTVDVIQKPITLSVPKAVDFGTYTLGSNDKKLFWYEKDEVLVEDTGKQGWELTVSLKMDSDFNNYIFFKETPLSTNQMLIDSGNGNKVVSDELINEDFIFIDYSSVKELRNDSAILEWNLTTSTKEINE